MAVIGASPVTFISEDTTVPNAGKEYQIPLYCLTFNAAGTAIDPTSTWPGYAVLAATDQTLVKNVLANLVSRNLLTPSP